MVVILFFKCYFWLGRIALAAGQEPQFSGRIFQKQLVFSPPTAQFRPREHHAVIRLATAISVHKFSSKKALCSLSSSKIIDFYKESSFSTVCRRATASGVSRREPPRHGVHGKKMIIEKDLQKP